MKARNIIRTIHLWLGLLSGLVVFILGVTGCIYVFANDIREAFNKERFFVDAQESPKLPLSRILEAAQQAVGPEFKISRGKIYNAPNRAYEFRALKTDPKAFGYWNHYVYYYRVYINPYTGQVTFKEDARNSFISIVVAIHTTLLLGKAVGHSVVKWSVICFVALLISGLMLWWPKKNSKKQFSKAFTIKWNAKFKRLNYDLHNVAGFYSLLVLLVIALTGLMMSFELHVVKYPTAKSNTVNADKPHSDIHERILANATWRSPNAAFFYYNIPADSTGTINVSAYASESNFYQRSTYKYGQFSAKPLLIGKPFSDLPSAAKIQTINFDLHTGSAFGLFGKIVAFIASFVAASLPITGLLIWLGKKKKNKSPNKIKSNHPYNSEKKVSS